MLGYHSAVGGVCIKAAYTAILLQILIHLQSYLTLTIASEIVKICAPESSSKRTGISGCRSHERCITTMGHSPILGSLGGRLLEDSLEPRFLLLELILLLEWLSCSFPSVQVNFTVAIFGSWIFVLRFLVS